jgi:hypothetical protein
MSLQDAFMQTKWAIEAGYHSHRDPARCECHGSGWILTDFDTWHECPLHRGRPHPEDPYVYAPEPWEGLGDGGSDADDPGLTDADDLGYRNETGN